MSDLREGLDELQNDMQLHQRRFSGEVTAEANRALAASAVERMERELADIAAAPPLVSAGPPPPIAKSVERREVDGKNYVVSKGPDAPMLRQANEAEHWFLSHALPRIELLMNKDDTGPLGQPSWRSRVLAVMELKSRVPSLRLARFDDLADDTERRYMAELTALLEDSSRLFGDWKADAPKKVMVG